MSDDVRPLWPFSTDEAMNDAIDAWHKEVDNHTKQSVRMPLHAWLGMSHETYREWLKHPSLRAEAWERRDAAESEPRTVWEKITWDGSPPML